jgi:hypothetical protein
MSDYQARRGTDAVVRKSDNKIIGPEHQKEWTEYQAWIAKGNTPEEPESILETSLEPTIQEKLQRAGISIEELKSALGI